MLKGVTCSNEPTNNCYLMGVGKSSSESEKLATLLSHILYISQEMVGTKPDLKGDY